jgi:CBS domain-containing protein
METRFNAIPIDATLAEAIETLLATAQHEFPVIDAFGKPVGLLAREDMYAALKSHGREASVATFMRAPVETIRDTVPLVAVLDRLNGSQLRLSLSPIRTGLSSASSLAKILAR